MYAWGSPRERGEPKLVVVLVTVVKYDPRCIRPFKGEKNKQSGIVVAGLIY